MNTHIKTFILSFFAMFILVSGSAFAGDVVKVNVNGMVCDFCARAIEKVFSKQEAFEAVDVNLTDKLITVTMKDGQNVDDEGITKLVNDSGYAVVGIEREGGEVSDDEYTEEE